MSKIVVSCRYVYFSLLAALLLTQLGLASSTVSYKSSSLQRQVAVYSVFISVLGLMLTAVIMFIDFFRENALFSKVMVELTWLTILFIFEIADAAALTALLPQLTCTNERMCNIFGATTGIAWVITLLVVSYLLLLLVSAILHHDAYPHVWKTGVRDFPWFVNSRPGSRLGHASDSFSKPQHKKPFYRKRSDLAASQILAPKAPTPPNHVLPDDYNPSGSVLGPTIAVAPKVYQQPAPRPAATFDFLHTIPSSSSIHSKESDRRGRSTKPSPVGGSIHSAEERNSPRPSSRRPSRKRPPPLDLSKLSAHRI